MRTAKTRLEHFNHTGYIQQIHYTVTQVSHLGNRFMDPLSPPDGYERFTETHNPVSFGKRQRGR